MALAWIPRAFKTILENLQSVDIRHRVGEVPNLKIRVPSSFSHNFYYFSRIFFYLSQIIYKMALTLLPV